MIALVASHQMRTENKMGVLYTVQLYNVLPANAVKRSVQFVMVNAGP